MLCPPCPCRRRCLKEQQRKWRTLLIMVLQSLAMAALIGGTFFQIGDGQESRSKRLPVLFFCTVGGRKHLWLALWRTRVALPQGSAYKFCPVPPINNAHEA